MGKTYYVYIVASRSRNLYTGVTNNLARRVYQHREGLVPGFTRKYRIHRLVHFEMFDNVSAAIAREKQVKAWRREKRVALIGARNPAWDDLAERWFTVTGQKKQIPRFARDDNQGAVRGAKRVARDDESRGAWESLAPDWYTRHAGEKQIPRFARNDKSKSQSK